MEIRKKEPVWDIPTRLFHWLLVGAMIGMWYTGSELMMDIHFKLGYAVLGLLLFRFAWGFWGGSFSRFNAFQLSPSSAITYLTNNMHTRYPGHNPLGSWGIVLLLLSSTLQVTTGLFANDSILEEGPLAQFVSADISNWLTSIHTQGFDILLVLIAIHIAAVVFHAAVRKEDLVPAMVTGRREVDPNAPKGHYGSWKAFTIIVAVVLIAIGGVISLAPTYY